jgi:hypothetical protein
MTIDVPITLNETQEIASNNLVGPLIIDCKQRASEIEAEIADTEQLIKDQEDKLTALRTEQATVQNVLKTLKEKR